MKPPSGVIGEDGIEVQRVAVAQVGVSAPAEPDLVTPANLHVYEFDWSPDSKCLAYIAADPPGENNWWVAKLYTERLPDAIDATSFSRSMRSALGTAPKPILAPAETPGPLHGLQIAVPRWSPDGKIHRLHRRPDERPGLHRRRCLDRLRRRRPAARPHAEPAHFAGLDRMGRQRSVSCSSANWLAATPSLSVFAFSGNPAGRSISATVGSAHLQHSRHVGDGRIRAQPLLHRRSICFLSSTPAPSTVPLRSTPSIAGHAPS